MFDAGGTKIYSFWIRQHKMEQIIPDTTGVETKMKVPKMKKTFFLIASGMVIWFSGCTGANYDLYRPVSAAHKLVNTRTPTPINRNEDRGVCLALSPRSSLDIDVECILDYVEGDTNLDSLGKMENLLNPWIRWHLSF
jgi:hypothetical protein